MVTAGCRASPVKLPPCSTRRARSRCASAPCRGTCWRRRRGCRRAPDPGRRPRCRASPRHEDCGCVPAPPRPDLALVERVDAGDALDQRRLAGAVVADQGHHLAAADLEVDPVERLDGAERLRDAPALEERCVSHVAHSLTHPPSRSGGRLPGDPPIRCVLSSIRRSGVRLAELGLQRVARADLLHRPEPVGDHRVGDVVDGDRRSAPGRSTAPRRHRSASRWPCRQRVPMPTRSYSKSNWVVKMSSPARRASAIAAARPASGSIGL